MKKAVVESFIEVRKRKYSVKAYKSSIIEKNGMVFFLIRENLTLKLVMVVPPLKLDVLEGFDVEETGSLESEGFTFRYLICSCNHQNGSVLRRIFAFARPRVIGLKPALGTGDRIGLATPGHVRAASELNVFPVLAQQSVREMNRTLRTPYEVLDDVSWAVFQEGYRGGFAADADHLKTMEDVNATFDAGFTMYTIDPSDYVDEEADKDDLERLKEKFEEISWNELELKKEDYFKIYLGKKLPISLPSEGKPPRFSEETLLRATVKYSAAVAHTVKLYRRLKELFGKRKFDLEMSVDETEAPTSLLEHFYIVSELKRLGVRICGLALRFVGSFEKAIDYVGDLKEFEESFMKHVLIARSCGPYKLSIHSGSDKFSVYPIVGKFASDMVHLKTAGTSYLEALRVIARHDPALFRKIIEHSLKCFEKDRRSYNVSTDLSSVPNPDEVTDENLETAFLIENNSRQLLHITYGSILTARTDSGEWLFRDKIRKTLIENEEEHYETVANHMRLHTEALRIFAEKK